jgi:membrane protein DedA with SNARE-associated domain
MSQFLGFFNKHRQKIYVALGVLAVIVVIVVSVYVWKKMKEEKKGG